LFESVIGYDFLYTEIHFIGLAGKCGPGLTDFCQSLYSWVTTYYSLRITRKERFQSIGLAWGRAVLQWYCSSLF